MDAINYRHRIEVLEEENASLRARIAVLTGRNIVADIRRVFGVSELQGRLFAILLARGEVCRTALIEEVYDERFADMDDPDASLRSVLKSLRRAVAPFGIDFETIYAHGYRVPDECRAIARSKIAQMVAAE